MTNNSENSQLIFATSNKGVETVYYKGGMFYRYGEHKGLKSTNIYYRCYRDSNNKYEKERGVKFVKVTRKSYLIINFQ